MRDAQCHRLTAESRHDLGWPRIDGRNTVQIQQVIGPGKKIAIMILLTIEYGLLTELGRVTMLSSPAVFLESVLLFPTSVA